MSCLAPVWAGEGFPADVRHAPHMLASLDLDSRETAVLVACSMARLARATLAERNPDPRGAEAGLAERLVVVAPG